MLPSDFSSPISLSALVITKNESMNIAECLDSLRWVDEIVVVDAESTDETTEIAKKYTDHVFIRPWSGFGPQKNFGFDQVTSKWILILDADERVDQKLAEEIQDLLARPSKMHSVAYRIPRRNFFYGKWVQWGGAYPDYQIRLFQKGKARYNDIAVHENLIVDGQVGTLAKPIIHYTERQIADHFKKFTLYTTLAAAEKGKSQKFVSWYHLTFNPLVIFLKTYFLKKGFKDGRRGIIFAVFASMYTFVKYTKLFESHMRDERKIP